MSLPPIKTSCNESQPKVKVDGDLLIGSLKRMEARHPQKKLELLRKRIIKKIYEELAFPPADIVGTSEWMEENIYVRMTLPEVKNLFSYVKMFMPKNYVHPKYAIPYLLDHCSLKVPTSSELLDWKEKFGDEAVQVTRLPRLASIRRSSRDVKLSEVFNYVGGKWNYSRRKAHGGSEEGTDESRGYEKSARRKTHTGSMEREKCAMLPMSSEL